MNSEDFNDEQFCHYFFKLFDMLRTQEEVIQSPISFSTCMKDLVECVSAMKFTKHGVRVGNVPKINMKRAKSNEISFRIRNNRGNLSAQSHSVLAKHPFGAAPGPLRRNGLEDFQKQYQRMEAASQEKLSLLNPHLVHHIGMTAASG